MGGRSGAGAKSRRAVQGAAGRHTLYLFGTIHVARRFLSAGAALAGLLKKAPVLALEIDPLGDPQKLARAVQQHGLSSKATQGDWRQRLERLLQAVQHRTGIGGHHEALAAGQPADGERVCRPGLRGVAGGGCASVETGATAGQKVVELESADSQMALFDKMTPPSSCCSCRRPSPASRTRSRPQAREIADAWRKADVAALDALALKAEQDDTFSGRFVQQVLLDGRNPALADGMVKLMARENNSVAAIGVLHLVGKTSVPELLRKRGLSVERIY
jgi:uncharacterized protein YbaP (TraB family)